VLHELAESNPAIFASAKIAWQFAKKKAPKPQSDSELRVQIPAKTKTQSASLFCCASFTAYLYMT
jgi:hypothetical protein